MITVEPSEGSEGAMPQRRANAPARLPLGRRSDILSLIEQNGQASVAELSQMFSASDDTIRRDLDALAAQGKLKRAHGGAISLSDESLQHEPIVNRYQANVRAKDRIARRAAALVGDGETLFINGGTTTLGVAKELASKPRLTVLTNNLLIPALVDKTVTWDLYVMGGRYHAGSQVTTRTEGFSLLTTVTTDTAIIGVGGVSPDSGFTVSLFEDAAAIRPMVSRAARVIIVADSSKFGKDNLVPISVQDKPTFLLTDKHPGDDISDWLLANSIELVVA